MSTVVSAVKGNTIYICADTIGTTDIGTQRYTNKLFDGGGYLVAVVGSMRPYISMLYDYTHPPDRGLPTRDYIQEVRAALKNTLSHLWNDDDTSYTIHLGFCYQGQPHLIEYDSGHGDIQEVGHMGWVCLGHGKEVAMGVMGALWDTDMDTRSVMEKAIEVAARYDAYTALPSEYLCLTA